ncbi:hypothetical protein QN277_010669 [Acacia crassicarpa]|uniref:Uncharacterized protein n=1 Tax=Acacia crassicarpa TaxID=499986 RepID=A0AAE1IQ92_9FABA|nr:hypothetical protein QN277_010669 [Acacia crassicarpa]
MLAFSKITKPLIASMVLECYYNTIEACALHVCPLTTNLPFIHGVENHLQQKQKDTSMWQLCANNLKLNPQSILNCYTSGLGNKLILQNAEETLKLNPPPKYLPRVTTVNNEPIFRDYNNVIKYICDAYRGKSKPSACKSTISVPQTPSLCDPPEAKLESPQSLSDARKL